MVLPRLDKLLDKNWAHSQAVQAFVPAKKLQQEGVKELLESALSLHNDSCVSFLHQQPMGQRGSKMVCFVFVARATIVCLFSEVCMCLHQIKLNELCMCKVNMGVNSRACVSFVNADVKTLKHLLHSERYHVIMLRMSEQRCVHTFMQTPHIEEEDPSNIKPTLQLGLPSFGCWTAACLCPTQTLW